MELRDYLRIVRKGWILITAIALVAIGAAAAYSFLKTPEYSASAKVFVSVQSSETVSDLAQGNTLIINKVKTYAELVSTPAVLQPVIDDLAIEATVTDVAKQITATAPLDTTLIQIDATSTDPALAADLANSAAQNLSAAVAAVEAPAVGDGASPVRITQVTDALVPTSPESPNIPLNLALGALIGLALGLGVAVLRETLDTRIRGEHDVQSVTDAPIVGGIPFDTKAEERPLIVQDDPRSIRAESFRSLRTNFQFLGGGSSRRTFVFTSAVQGEGKTTTVANLAIALADAGRRVVVIDADLRRPRLADMLGLEGAAGLTDLLIGRAEFDDLVQPWGRGNLDVLPAGRIPPNPSELLGSTAMVDLIARLEQRYEYVLFDAAPLLPVTDAAVLATHVSGTVIVVAAGRTRKAQLRATIAALENVEVKPVGLVLSMLPTKGPDAYSYGYGYGDIADPAENPAWEPLADTVVPRPAEPSSGDAAGPRRSTAVAEAPAPSSPPAPVAKATVAASAAPSEEAAPAGESPAASTEAPPARSSARTSTARKSPAGSAPRSGAPAGTRRVTAKPSPTAADEAAVARPVKPAPRKRPIAPKSAVPEPLDEDYPTPTLFDGDEPDGAAAAKPAARPTLVALRSRRGARPSGSASRENSR